MGFLRKSNDKTENVTATGVCVTTESGGWHACASDEINNAIYSLHKLMEFLIIVIVIGWSCWLQVIGDSLKSTHESNKEF